MAAPSLHVANCPACEMVSHVKTWSKDLGPSGGDGPESRQVMYTLGGW